LKVETSALICICKCPCLDWKRE